jgi:hypothetical protein
LSKDSPNQKITPKGSSAAKSDRSELNTSLSAPASTEELPPKAKHGGKRNAIDEPTRKAIIADRIAGFTNSQVAAKYGVHPMTVSKFFRRFQKEAPQAEAAISATDWKQRLKVKSINAIEAGLDCQSDPYKRAGVGLQVMKGIGEFAPDTVPEVAVLLTTIPGELRTPFGLNDQGEFDPVEVITLDSGNSQVVANKEDKS